MKADKQDKEFVNDCVDLHLSVGEALLEQARGNAYGGDGIGKSEAVVNAREAYALFARARLFCVEPERYANIHRAMDRHTTNLAGIPWRPDTLDTIPPKEETQKLLEVYERSVSLPFPDPMAFDAIFFCYGKKLNLSMYSPSSALFRIGPDELEKFGNPDVYLVGHLLAWSGEVPSAFAVLILKPTEQHDVLKYPAVAVTVAYRGEWYQPMTLDPWILETLVRSVNQHKKIIQEYAPTLGQRMDRKKASKAAKTLLPLPAPFYMVKLTDELIEPPTKKPAASGSFVEWSHRWDVRGHESCRIMRGEAPLSAKDAAKLKRREYRIYEGTVISAEDAERLLKRGIRAPHPREWIAIKSWWRDAFVKGPQNAPYVPAARVGV